MKRTPHDTSHDRYAPVWMLASILMAAAALTIVAAGAAGAESTMGELSSFLNGGG